jgi:hypothetical protein
MKSKIDKIFEFLSVLDSENVSAILEIEDQMANLQTVNWHLIDIWREECEKRRFFEKKLTEITLAFYKIVQQEDKEINFKNIGDDKKLDEITLTYY